MILPVYAGLDRMPDSLLDASGDLGARPARTVRSVVVPLVYPSIVAGSVFTFSLSLGDYITVQIVGGRTQMLGNIVYQNYTSSLPFAAAIALIPVVIMVDLPDAGAPHGRAGQPVRNSRRARWTFGLLMLFGLAFIYVPLGVIVINSFNASTVFAWPPQAFTTHWWSPRSATRASGRPSLTSVEVGIVATAVALVLGTLLAFALGRYTFFGRHTLSLLVVLPIALPGIVTALAFRTGLPHVPRPRAVDLDRRDRARDLLHRRRLQQRAGAAAPDGHQPEEASMDLGADTFTTFRLVTFPLMRGALVAGALLAFGLSFDEIVVTLFTAPPGVTTLPIWIFQNLSAAEPGAGGQRRRSRAGARVDLPDLPEPEGGRGVDERRAALRLTPTRWCPAACS